MSERDLDGRVALVTGASRGIGRAIALALAAHGAHVAVNYHANERDAAAVVDEIASHGGRALAVLGDVASVPDVRSLFAQTVDRLGGLDIFVSNAGFFIFRPVAEMSESDYDALFAMNARGVFFALQEAARRIRDGGRIIVMSAASTGGTGAPNSAAAVASKAAAEQFARGLARELGPRNVTVNVVSPGPTRTEGFAKLPPAVQESAARLSPLGRIGEPEEIAAVVAFLASPAASWLTGQNLRATGGG